MGRPRLSRKGMHKHVGFGILYRSKDSFKPYWTEGNNCAAKENMSEESHKKRMNGLFAAWKNNVRAHTGEKFMDVRTKMKISRGKKRNFRNKVALEALNIQKMARENALRAMQVDHIKLELIGG